MTEYSTGDLSFAAYLMMQGCALLKAQRTGKINKFYLDVGDRNIEQVKIQFINSESSKFDAAVRDLKRIIFSCGV